MTPSRLAAATLALCLSTAAHAQDTLQITHVTVIDPASRTVRRDMTVTLSGGLIAAVEPAARAAAPEGVRAIDGRGRFLMPGLMDMHVHTNVAPVTETSLALFLAHGITSVRDMAGDCWEPQTPPFLCRDDLVTYNARIDAGELAGPDLVRLSSAFVQSDRTGHLPPDADPMFMPQTEEQGRALVDYLDARGVDLVKMYHAIFPAAYEGLMARAGELGLEVSGHIPLVLSAAQASAAGQRTLEHAKDIVTDCSGFGAEYRSRIRAVVGGDRTAQWPDDAERLSRTVASFDAETCRALMRELAANGTYYVPTHGTREMDVRAGDPAYRDHPALAYIPGFQRQHWDTDLDRTAAEPAEVRDHYARFYALGLEVTALAHEEGVAVMVGTDANDTMIIPGVSAHEELARLVEAGLSPMDALRAATATPAGYLGRSETLGIVQAGAEADLLLLDANPLDAIGNTQAIAAVIADGRLRDRASLNALLDNVRQRAAEGTLPGQ
ncbi:MAG: amidohydrolase family protein [Pseudomonadota bacterium]|nr:amidohydrolase family protein [Pseudomonadota bacterium]